MSDRKAVIKNADMSEDMQQDAIDCATQARPPLRLPHGLSWRLASCPAAAWGQEGLRQPANAASRCAGTSVTLRPPLSSLSAARCCAPVEAYAWLISVAGS